MLVLSRKAGQSIQIGDQITVTIVELSRGRVRVGIAAPAHVLVNREEVALRGGMAPPPVELPGSASRKTSQIAVATN